MCELFAVSATHKIPLYTTLKEFFSHSKIHSSGWGLAILDDGYTFVEKEPIRAIDSTYLKARIGLNFSSACMIGHIRRATIGEINYDNSHPFVMPDHSGRVWTLVHNGTIFESEELARFQKTQKGTTDSERILCYLIDQVNRALDENDGMHADLSRGERFELIDRMIQEITPGNKVNLIIHDGEYFYIHKNQEDTLYVKQEKGAAVFSTTRLGFGNWRDVPMNQLQIYREGELVWTGTRHENTYVYNEDQYKPLYLAYASL